MFSGEIIIACTCDSGVELASYYGWNLIDQWMIPFFGASVYDDPDVYEKSSLIRFIKNNFVLVFGIRTTGRQGENLECSKKQHT